ASLIRPTAAGIAFVGFPGPLAVAENAGCASLIRPTRHGRRCCRGDKPKAHPPQGFPDRRPWRKTPDAPRCGLSGLRGGRRTGRPAYGMAARRAAAMGLLAAGMG